MVAAYFWVVCYMLGLELWWVWIFACALNGVGLFCLILFGDLAAACMGACFLGFESFCLAI